MSCLNLHEGWDSERYIREQQATFLFPKFEEPPEPCTLPFKYLLLELSQRAFVPCSAKPGAQQYVLLHVLF
jgi:hypothetical protein